MPPARISSFSIGARINEIDQRQFGMASQLAAAP
jgi:hypothetical protein